MSATLKAQASVLGGAVALMWLMFIATWMTGGALLSLGVIPRTLIGLSTALAPPHPRLRARDTVLLFVVLGR